MRKNRESSDHNMPFIVSVPVNSSAIKYFHTEIEHLMLVLLVKMFFFVFIDVEIFAKCLHDAENVTVVL